ncbi:MAG: hypothetical protein LC797_22095, partial [Chloroflexi bacterium]|nr:hypothetical protein [Chloroflexota bacterium]
NDLVACECLLSIKLTAPHRSEQERGDVGSDRAWWATQGLAHDPLELCSADCIDLPGSSLTDDSDPMV